MLRQSDFLSGLLFMLLGLAFGIGALSYRIGTPATMGAGFLPISLSSILFILGLVTVIKAQFRTSEPVDWGSVVPLVIVIASIVGFAIALRPLGFAATAFLTVFAVSFAGPRIALWKRLALALGMALVATVVFVRLLGLPIPIWPQALS